MPPVRMPDGTIAPLPDHPTLDQLQRLKTLHDRMQQAHEENQPTQQPSPSLLKGMFLGGPVPGPMEAGRQIVSGVTDITKKGALPTLGAIGGGFLGGIPGEMIGSGAGEIANQAFGLTQQSPFQAGLAAAAPGIGRMIGPAARVLGRFGGPGRAAATLNTIAPQEAEQILTKMAPKEAYQSLFQKATEEGGQIDMAETSKMLTARIKELSSISTPPTSLKPLQRLQSKITASGGNLSPAELQKELESIGELTKSFQKTGGTGSGALKSTFESMSKDLDEAAASGADTLKLARQTFKRSKTLDEIGTSIENATKTLRGQGGQVQFNASQVIRDLNKNPYFKQSFNPQEQKEILDLFKNLNRIPALKPGAGQQFGSGKFWHSTVPYGLGIATSGGARGDVAEMAAGAGIAAISPVVETAKTISQVLHFETGRALMKQLLTQGGGRLTPRSMSILSAFLRSQTASPAQMGTGPGAAEQLQVPQGQGNGAVQGF